MRSCRVAVLSRTAIVPVLVLLAASGWAQTVEQWRCAFDLHQGDRGTLELSRAGSRIEGLMIIPVGERKVEHKVSGEWQGEGIAFSRVLSATSFQPFRGTVSATAADRATMAGQFAAGFAGAWSAECQRTQVSVSPSVTPEARRSQPAPPKASRDAKTVAQVNTLDTTMASRDARTVVQVNTLGTTLTEMSGVILDLQAKAPTAKWTDSWAVVGFAGDPANPRGFARYVDNAVLEDGQAHGRVLEAHPASHKRAILVGRYAGVTIPQTGAELQAGIGFLKDAVAPDGIYFEVRGEFDAYHGLRLRREYLERGDGHVVADFTQDLSRFRGLTGTVVLSVAVGDRDSVQPGAVWVAPRLVSPAGEPLFASFVGGAVGSGRNGSQLQNAWGEFLYGEVTLVLVFANVDRSYTVQIESYFGEQSVGTTNLPAIQAGQTELWTTLQRTAKGSWRERVIFNGTYVGDLRYQISKL